MRQINEFLIATLVALLLSSAILGGAVHVTAAKKHTSQTTRTRPQDQQLQTQTVSAAPTNDRKLITTSDIADNAVTNPKIQDNAVTTSKVADNTVTTNKLADNAVTTAKIKDGTILKEDIKPGEIPLGAGAKAVANKIKDPDRDLGTEYDKEKVKEKVI